jgi:cell division protein FtsZ
MKGELLMTICNIPQHSTIVHRTSAEDAAIAAISSPLLDEPVSDATGVVFNIMGPRNLSLQDVNKAARVIYDNVHEDANVIFGALVDDDMENEVSITVLATGFNSRDSPSPPSSSLFGRPGSDVPDFLSRR